MILLLHVLSDSLEEENNSKFLDPTIHLYIWVCLDEFLLKVQNGSKFGTKSSYFACLLKTRLFLNRLEFNIDSTYAQFLYAHTKIYQISEKNIF